MRCACGMTNCRPRYPNSVDPSRVFTCHSCGDGIYPGEEYARIDSQEYCENCIDEMPYCVLIPMTGGEWKAVRKGEKVVCAGCKEELEEGQEYGAFDGSTLCEDCIDDIPYCELARRLGSEWNTAQEDDIYDGYDG